MTRIPLKGPAFAFVSTVRRPITFPETEIWVSVFWILKAPLYCRNTGKRVDSGIAKQKLQSEAA